MVALKLRDVLAERRLGDVQLLGCILKGHNASMGSERRCQIGTFGILIPRCPLIPQKQR